MAVDRDLDLNAVRRTSEIGPQRQLDDCGR
jgi:hypothetical protein